ncbi:TfoX/Sxy family protein [Rhodoferax sp.]|uniref:TfoX/Sxy family protein n=1 Tax=Rhodoferax sp. TaxID=50421 RepID=UPI002ACE8B77|nr:TfoX/Sxy family protein [Rhodoferax sp.]MDZ7921959.1 TfoX/Sxy family protein [Rhodoferax sp.]
MPHDLAGLPNLGAKSCAMLLAAGIRSADDLHRLGSVASYLQVKRQGGNASLNLLWALEGAISGLHWQEVAREHRTSLLLALEDCERMAGAAKGE